MGFGYYRRINFGGGLGLNLSKSGISPSYRGKYGSVGPKGFSIRTGIPGLSYRGGRRRSSDGGIVILTIMMAYVIITAAVMVSIGIAVVAWNILKSIGWAAVEIVRFASRKNKEYQAAKAYRTQISGLSQFDQPTTESLTASARLLERIRALEHKEKG